MNGCLEVFGTQLSGIMASRKQLNFEALVDHIFYVIYWIIPGSVIYPNVA